MRRFRLKRVVVRAAAAVLVGGGSSRTAVSPHLDAGEKRQQRDRAGADGQAPVRPSFSLSIFFFFCVPCGVHPSIPL